MNKTIKLKHILLYYDRIEIFEAVDNIGGNYIAVLVDYNQSSDRYIVVGVDPNRLNQFKIGLCDLRILFTRRDSYDWYYTSITQIDQCESVLEKQDADYIEEDLLPEEGFFLHEYVSETTGHVLSESKIHNNIVVGLSLIPKESYNHTIGLEIYKKAINFFEKMISNVFEDNKKFGLDVIVPAITGSVSILFEIRKQENLFFENDVVQSLSFLDDINGDVSNIPATIEKLSHSKGHFVKVYRDFVEFISLNNCSINYSWATPQSYNPIQRLINENDASKLYNELVKRNELVVVNKYLEGYLTSINTRPKKGSWTLKTDTGFCNGTAKEGLLKDKELTVNKNRYLFSCEEILTENEVTGVQEREYILFEYRQLD